MSDYDEKIIFTCISCRIQFENSEEQRDHYKSELHRFNLKRKAFDLPPVNEQTFKNKVEALKQEESKSKTPAKFECRICDKEFNSDGTYQQHLTSKKHKEMVSSGAKEVIRNRKPKEEKKLPETIEEAEAILEEKIKNSVKLPLENCLFCNNLSKTVEDNLKHMAKEHSFFVPDIEYLADLEGLLRYLLDKVSIGNVCLYCNGKGKVCQSKDATQTHMRDMGHCKINTDTEDGEDEIIEFYDYSKRDGAVTDENGELVAYKPEITVSTHEITFADGTTIGHRDYAVYYKQKYAPVNRREEFLRGVVGQYKQLGWHEAPKTAYELDKKFTKRTKILELKVGMKKNTQRFVYLPPSIITYINITLEININI
ncbi:hypothetical protein ACTFIR_002306 [Dictyostelium discoideum]